MKFNHLTVNSGSTMICDSAHLHKGRIKKIISLYPKGGELPEPLNGFRVDFGEAQGAVSFCIYRADVPIVMNVVCWSQKNSEEIFKGVEQLYNRSHEDAPEAMQALGTACHVEPPNTPWLATTLLPSIFVALSEEMSQDFLPTIANFEQCMATALMTKKLNQP